MSLQYDSPDIAQSNIADTRVDDANELVTKSVAKDQDNSNELFS